MQIKLVVVVVVVVVVVDSQILQNVGFSVFSVFLLHFFNKFPCP